MYTHTHTYVVVNTHKYNGKYMSIFSTYSIVQLKVGLEISFIYYLFIEPIHASKIVYI